MISDAELKLIEKVYNCRNKTPARAEASKLLMELIEHIDKIENHYYDNESEYDKWNQGGFYPYGVHPKYKKNKEKKGEWEDYLERTGKRYDVGYYGRFRED